MSRRLRALWPALPAVLAYLAFSTLFAIKTPLWEVPDEPAHFNYVRSLVDQHALPVLGPGDYNQRYLQLLMSAHFPPSMSIDSLRYESHQPPLYYLLIAPIYAAVRHLSQHAQVVSLRLATALLGVPLLLLACALVRSVFPRDTLLAFAVPAVMASIPEHLATSAGVENDVLAELVMTAVLLLLVRMISWWYPVAEPARATNGRSGEVARNVPRGLWMQGGLLGLLLGLVLLTKTTAYGSGLLAGAVLVGLAWCRWRAGLDWRPIAQIGLVALACIVVVSGWWFGRNMAVYGLGDPTGLGMHDKVVVGQPRTGALRPSTLAHLATTTFHSFWAQLGWMGVPAENAVYGGLLIICLLSTVGLVLGLLRLRRRPALLDGPQKAALLLLAGSVLVSGAEMAYYNLSYLQPQARYLFPALSPLTLAFVLGLREVVSERHATVVLILLWCGLLLFDAWAVYKYLPYLAP